jgi:hypothetical protein
MTFPVRAGPGPETSSITISPGDLVTAASTGGPFLAASQHERNGRKPGFAAR